MVHEIDRQRFAEAHAAGAPTVPAHCAGGYRAGIVAALLHARGRDVVAVDDDGFDNALGLGPCSLPSGIPATRDNRQEINA